MAGVLPRVEIKHSVELSKLGRNFDRAGFQLTGVQAHNYSLKEIFSEKPIEVGYVRVDKAGRFFADEPTPKEIFRKPLILRDHNFTTKEREFLLTDSLPQGLRPDKVPAEIRYAPLHEHIANVLDVKRPTLRNYCFEYVSRLRQGKLTQEEIKIANEVANRITVFKIRPLFDAIRKAEKDGLPPSHTRKAYLEALGYIRAVQTLGMAKPPTPWDGAFLSENRVAAAKLDMRLLKRTGAIKPG